MTTPANATPYEILADAIAQAVTVLWDDTTVEPAAIQKVADKLHEALAESKKPKHPLWMRTTVKLRTTCGCERLMELPEAQMYVDVPCIFMMQNGIAHTIRRFRIGHKREDGLRVYNEVIE